MEQYHWIFSKEEWEKLKTGMATHNMYCEETMKYGDGIEFKIGMCRAGMIGSDQTLLPKSVTQGSCYSRFSMMV